MLYIGADHRGFQLKEDLKTYLNQHDFKTEDLGALEFDLRDDYPDFASAVAAKVADDPENSRGILICGSGHGMDMAANKFKGVRAALCFNRKVAIQSREHEDANILVLASDWIRNNEAEDMVLSWLGKPFSGEDRHIRRISKISETEKENFR